ncbi:MAG TPA: arylesterase [Rudaea sp.]|nr:arylesterase [Rudaea sp.]
MRHWFLCFMLFFAAPAFAEGPVLVLGDSLSAAFHIDPSAGWVTLLSQRLKTQTPPVDVVNASISGETTAGGLSRLPALLAQHKPRIVVVELGANDGLRGLPIDQIRKNLDTIIKTSRDAGAKVVLLGIELPINYGPQYRTGLREMYRDEAKEFNVPLVPFLLDRVAQDPTLMQDDGMHPLAAGEPKVLENVWPTLRTAIGAK